jgi:hypothetical protein
MDDWKVAQMQEISTKPRLSDSLLEAIVVEAYIREVRR